MSNVFSTVVLIGDTVNIQLKTDIGFTDNEIKELCLKILERDFCILIAEITFQYLTILHTGN